MKRTEFVEFLTTTGLVASEEVARIERETPQVVVDDASALARQLVAKEKLTKFQAAAIYQGKGKSLIFGEHVVVDRIGAGGMGQVFKARHRRMDRIVALKVMSPAAIKNADAVKRFEREVRAAAKLSHPNVVHAYDAGVHEGAFFLVMEFVEGADFSSLLKQQMKFSIKQACSCFEQASRGFAAAHAKGIIHRDVKPGNLLLDRSGVVKILDMGLARIEDDGIGAKLSEGELTQSGSVMGTIDYMAPEQALNTHHADAKSDVYGLGCTFYRVLTGESVFGGQTLIEKVLAHREHPIPSIRHLRPDAPPALDLLIARMIAKSPTDRPTMQDVADTLAALDHAADGGGYSVAQETSAPAIPFPPQTFGQSLPPSTTIGPGVISKAAMSPKPVKKSSAPLLVGVGGAAVVAVALAAWTMMKGGNDERDGAVAAAPPGDGQIEVNASPAPSSPLIAPAPVVPKPAAEPTPTPTASGSSAPINPRTGLPNNPPTFAHGTSSSSSNVAQYSGPPDEIVLDAELERRAAMKVLSLGGTLSVQGPNFSGRITRPSEMPNLQFGINMIDLGKTNANDKDIEELAGLGALQSINLSYTNVSDACLPTMASFKRLRSLTVSGAGERISDAGLKSLEGLTELTYFSAQDTKVTGAASRALHAKIPNCRITWSGGILEGKPVVSRSYSVSFSAPKVSLEGRSSIDQAIISAGSPSSTASSSTSSLGTPANSVAANPTTSSSSLPSTMPVNSATTSAGSTTSTATTPTPTTSGSTPAIGSAASTETAAAGPKKPAVPSTADQQTALKSIKEIFADDYATAKTNEQKGALAAKLLEQAKQTIDDPNSRYVLLAEAKALATEASEVDTLFDALGALTAEYAVAEATTMVEAWNGLLKRPRVDPATIQRLHKESTTRFDIAVADARFDDAKHYGEFGLTTSRRVPNPAAATKLATERNAAVATRQKEWPALLALADKLKMNPDEPEANLAVARYQALVAEDWKSAFPLFAKSGDELWSGLAAKSMGDVGTPVAQSAAGDAWWDAAQTAKGTLKAELSAGALYWYDLAAPLLTGLPKTRVEKRRTELGNMALIRKIPPTSLPGFVDVTMLASNNASVGAMPNRTFGDPSPPRSSAASGSKSGRPAAATGDQRALAQSILAAGGTVHLKAQSATGTNFMRVNSRGVLPLENFTIDGVSFENMNPQTDQVDEGDIAMLVAVPNLRQLMFFGCRIDERAFAHIRNLTSLESISFGSVNLRDEHLSAIRQLTNLRSLSVSYCQITDACLVNLRELANLNNLNLTTTQITGVGFGQLTNLQRLNYLYFYSSPISDAGLLQIMRLPYVRRLDLANSAVTDSGIAALRGLSELEYICLRGTNTGDAALQSLQGRQGLKHVVVSNRVTTTAAEAFQKAMPGVRVEFPQQ